MDEFPEFERRSLDALRQPLEDRVVSIARVQGSAEFPADFILVAALNPYRGQEDGTSDLLGAMNQTYKNKISGPILDRIDIWLEVPHINFETLQQLPRKEGETDQARSQILQARTRMQDRIGNGATNAHLQARDIATTISLSTEVEQLLKQASQKLNLSPRSYHKLLKVARTIADIDDCDDIKREHVLEALQYRVPSL
jgi:magnesium chelatase family protein